MDYPGPRARPPTVTHVQSEPKHVQRAGRLQPQQFNTIHIPRATIMAPFLQYSALTPGQKRFLYSVCEAYGVAHMRKLMQQHYLNVLHRSIRTGADPPQQTNFLLKPQAVETTTNLDPNLTPPGEISGTDTTARDKTKRLTLPNITSHKREPNRRNKKKNAAR